MNIFFQSDRGIDHKVDHSDPSIAWWGHHNIFRGKKQQRMSATFTAEGPCRQQSGAKAPPETHIC